MKGNYFIRAGLLAGVVFSLGRALADDFDATTAPVGRTGAGLVTPVNQLITPAGTQVELPGIRPNALALSPDGKLLVTSGLTNYLIAVDPPSGKLLQRVVFPTGSVHEPSPLNAPILGADEQGRLSFTGLKFSPDGSRLYLANVVGDLKVFSVSRDHEISPLFSIALPAVDGLEHTNEIPAGLAVSADGRKLYVAFNLSNRAAEIDAATGHILRTWDVGVAPLDVALAGHKLYVSNWGGRRPSGGPTGPGGQGTLVRVDARSIASEGSVTIIDLASPVVASAQKTIVLGPHACALAVTPNGRWLVAASAGSDMLSVIDTQSDEVVDTLTTRQQPGDPFGAQPDALVFAPTGRTLYCANATQNAVAVFRFQPRGMQLLGLLPVGWFPGALAFDARDKILCVANLKSLAASPETSAYSAAPGYNTKQYAGSISLIPAPSKAALAGGTAMALADLRYPLIAQAMLPPRLDRAAVPVPERAGEACVFRHVIYIIKENRTYDQILGDVTSGNGDAALCNFGERVTPNEHQLVLQFALLDNTYCSGILSADGHQWADSALATDYVEREFAGWPRSYPAGGFGDAGRDALAYSPAGFIWDNALAHHKTVHDFGEFTTSTKRWKITTRSAEINSAAAWRYFSTGANEIEYTAAPDIAALGPYMEHDWCSWDLDVPDVLRAAKFIARLKDYAAKDSLPDLTILWLPNDHTSGVKAGSPTPAAQVADNDLAIGQVVEAVSHSPFWKTTCIIAVEDDPQNGWDHVSGYRTTAYVISPYTRHGAIISTQYNQTSLLRTMELMLGLPPMNQFDATATPLFDCFTNTPDYTAYTAVTNKVPLNELNPSAATIPDTKLRQDAWVSARLPLTLPDECPEDVLNRILWRATRSTPYPEWAVKKVDDD